MNSYQNEMIPATSESFKTVGSFFSQQVPISVPVSPEVVPVSALKYVLNNKIINQSNHSSSAIKWALSMTDRFFSQITKNSNAIIDKPDSLISDYLCTDSDAISIFSSSDYYFITALSTVSRLQSFFSSFGDKRLFNTVAEVYLTVREKNYIAAIQNPRAYFFKSIRNALLYPTEYYPRLQKLIDKKRSENNKKEVFESSKIQNNIEDKLYDDAVSAYEQTTGKKIKGVFDHEFAVFYTAYTRNIKPVEKKSETSEIETIYEPDEDSIIDNAFNLKRDLYEQSKRSFGNIDEHYLQTCDKSVLKICEIKSIGRAQSCLVKEDYFNDKQRKSNVMVRLINGRKISSDEYAILPLHIQSRCECFSIDSKGEPTYILKKIE